jgi:hypothetical protein
VLADADILAIGVAADVHLWGIISGPDLFGEFFQMAGFCPPEIPRKVEGWEQAEGGTHGIIAMIQPMDTDLVFFQNEIIEVPPYLMETGFFEAVAYPLGMKIVQVVGLFFIHIVPEVLQREFLVQVFFGHNEFDFGFEGFE